MALKILRISGGAYAFWTVATLACVSQAALVAIAINLVTTALAVNDPIYRIAWTAAVADIVAFLAIAGTACLYIFRDRRQIQVLLCTAFALVATLGACLTIYTLAWIWNNSPQGQNQKTTSGTIRALTIAGFTLWGTAVITQIMLYATMLWPTNERVTQLPAEELSERPSPVRSVKRSISVHLASLAPPPAPPFMRSVSEPSSPTFSTQSSSPKSSFRHSMHQAMRPMTSKTKLLLRHPSFSRDSYSLHSGRETSLDAIRQDDEFEDWDTSGVEDMNEDHWSRRATKRRLETIPGSRPVSPAKPLDGPFPDQAPEDVHLPDSPMHSPVGSPSSDTGSFRMSRPPTRPGSSADQSHIHPLFRSESPVPPPVASPGTVITASPFAGQIVNSENQTFVSRKLHSAHSFRVESPSPLSPPRSRQSSFRSVRMPQPQSPGGEHHIVSSPSQTFRQSTEQDG